MKFLQRTLGLLGASVMSLALVLLAYPGVATLYADSCVRKLSIANDVSMTAGLKLTYTAPAGSSSLVVGRSFTGTANAIIEYTAVRGGSTIVINRTGSATNFVSGDPIALQAGDHLDVSVISGSGTGDFSFSILECTP